MVLLINPNTQIPNFQTTLQIYLQFQTIMDLHNSGEQDHFDRYLENQSYDHGLKLFSSHHDGEGLEEQKFLTPVTKKKGRPKGLKTNKEKAENKAQSQKSNKNSGHWLKQQNKRYHWFLQIHSNHFIHRHLRRMDKIFKSMADFIGTRQAEQCRSHHQKMQKKYNSFLKIIKSLRKEFYMSCDPANVQLDFQNNQITGYDPLITEQALLNQKEQDGQPQAQGKEQPEIQLEVEYKCPNKNFFQDSYENELRYQEF